MTTPLTVAVDPDEFAGQIALVTAAAGRGIGQAIACTCAREGAAVAVDYVTGSTFFIDGGMLRRSTSF